MESLQLRRARGRRDLVIGVLSLLVGAVVSVVSYRSAGTGGRYVVAIGAMAVGVFEIIRGLTGISPGGFQQFVAWRYLMAPRPRKFSEALVGFSLICLFALLFAVAFGVFIPLMPPFAFGDGQVPLVLVACASAALAFTPTYAVLAAVIATTTVGSSRSLRVSLWAALLSGLASLVIVACVAAIRTVGDPQGGLGTMVEDPGAYQTLAVIAQVAAALPPLGLLALFSFVPERVTRWVASGLVLVSLAALNHVLAQVGGAAEVPWAEGGVRLWVGGIVMGVGTVVGVCGGVLFFIRLGRAGRRVPIAEARTHVREAPDHDRMDEARSLQLRGIVLMGLGALIAPAMLFVSYGAIGVGLFIAGAALLSKSFWVATSATHSGRARLQQMARYDAGPGRYESLALAGTALFVLGATLVATVVVTEMGEPILAALGMKPGDEFRPLWLPGVVRGALILMSISVSLVVVRYFFSFFTTVSIGGVMVGTMALIMVLSVMGGFENDLREKILGSNAHILVSKLEGDFTEYREVGERIGRIEAVQAYSPYVLSEVVIAARQNYANVIIKGVDPTRVGKVTQLEEDIEQRYERPLDRLYPLAPDGGVLGPPADAAPRPDTVDAGPGADAMDPVPDDFDIPDYDPVDLSGGLSSAPGAAADAGPSGARAPGELDPPPEDLAIPEGEPMDLSGGLSAEEMRAQQAPDAGADDGAPTMAPVLPPGVEPGPHMPPPPGGPDDLFEADPEPLDTDEQMAAELGLGEVPPMSLDPAIAELPGVLVGSELVKTLSNYVGQEVTVVSPLGQDTPLGPVPRTKRYRVAGTFFTGMYEYDLKFVYVELTSLQDFLDIGDQVNGIEIRIDDPNNTEPVMAALRQELGPNYRVQDWRELNKSLFSALKLEKIAMFIVLAIIILVASFSIVGNLVMIVIEKAREIAVLKTLGASDRSVTDIFVRQGFVIGVLGTVVGVSLGLVHTLVTLQGFPLDPNVYYIDRLPISLDQLNVVYVAVAALVISSLATVYPASLAAGQRPVEGLARE